MDRLEKGSLGEKDARNTDKIINDQCVIFLQHNVLWIACKCTLQHLDL